MEPFLLSGLRYCFQDHDRGAFAVGAPNDTVRELTGRDAEDFETIARRHAALPASRHSFGARLAAFARFMAVPILPGFDPAIYDRAQEHPCRRRRVSRSTTPTGRRATASRAQGGGAKSVEGGIRMMPWSHLADRTGLPSRWRCRQAEPNSR